MKITAKNFELTDTLKDYVEKRLANLDRYFDGVMNSEVIFYEQRGRYTGELIVRAKGKTMKAQTSDKDILKVVDDLKEIITKELRRYKEKLKNHRKS